MQERDIKALQEERDELLKEIQDIKQKQENLKFEFYTLKEALVPVLNKVITLERYEKRVKKEGRRGKKDRDREEVIVREEAPLEDLPQYIVDFYKVATPLHACLLACDPLYSLLEVNANTTHCIGSCSKQQESEEHKKGLDEMGQFKELFLTSLEMLLGALPVGKKEKKQFGPLRKSIEEIKSISKSEALAWFSFLLSSLFLFFFSQEEVVVTSSLLPLCVCAEQC